MGQHAWALMAQCKLSCRLNTCILAAAKNRKELALPTHVAVI